MPFSLQQRQCMSDLEAKICYPPKKAKIPVMHHNVKEQKRQLSRIKSAHGLRLRIGYFSNVIFGTPFVKI